MPTLHSSAVMTPGQLGPMSVQSLPRRYSRAAHHVLHGNAFGDADDHLDACFGGFHDGIRSERRRNEDDADIGLGGLHGIAHGFEHGTVQVLLSAFAGGYAAHHVGAVLDHLGGVEGAFATGEALDQDLALLVDEYAHGWDMFGLNGGEISPMRGTGRNDVDSQADRGTWPLPARWYASTKSKAPAMSTAPAT